MRMEIVLLGKNFYDINNQQGASVVVYGEHEETNNKAGISISEASIDFTEHEKINIFPAKYSANAQLVSAKNRAGKNVTSLKLTNLELIEKLEFSKVKDLKDGNGIK